MASVKIRQMDARSASFQTDLSALLAYDESTDHEIHLKVSKIIEDVRSRGDEAVLELTRQYDRFSPENIAELELSKERMAAACEASRVPVSAVQAAAERIRHYAERQKLSSWTFEEPDGTLLGQKVSPLDRVGLYVPGGKASYPSSVLMNAIPAKVAGVPELIMVVPTPLGEVNELVLAAAHISGVDRVFCIGGAQAIAALAYGTESIPRVDKIVGPGNIFVATAKKMVFGQVGIDMIAGPSEILIISDGGTDPDWIAMDLFSQAEHDENAQAILITQDASHLRAVLESIEKLLPQMERKAVIRASLEGRGALILVDDLNAAADLVNRIAPEHLEVSVAEPEPLVEKIRHAGAIFMGRYTAEPLGDYCAGPNHVLPTSGTARFSSPLGVYDFQKRSSLINCSPQGADTLGRIASILARGESLTAHACSAEFRVSDRNV